MSSPVVAERWQVLEAIDGRFYDEEGRPVDRSGSVIPHTLGMAAFMRAVPILKEAFRTSVPESKWNEDVEEDTYLAQVDCPCGEKPIVELGDIKECVCERFYYFGGTPTHAGRRHLRVAGGPQVGWPDSSS